MRLTNRSSSVDPMLKEPMPSPNSTSLLVAALLVTLASPGPALAQPSIDLAPPTDAPEDAPSSEDAPPSSRLADPALVARMEAQLVQRAHGDEVSGVVNGVIGLGFGGVLIGGSIWLALDVGAFGGFGGPSPILITSLAVAPMMIASGIYSLIGIRSNTDRLLRWRAAMDGELSAIELARFEGELRAEANAARVSRWGSFALGVGILVGGVIAMILGGALDGFDDDFRAITIGGGGGFVAIGGVLMGTSFLESSVEQMWNQYRRGDAAQIAGFSIRPVFGLGGVGLVGTF